MPLEMTKLSVGPMDNNAYLLRCSTTGTQLMIDAANEPDRLIELVGDGGLATVVTTHRHPDHWQGLTEVVAATGAESIAHDADAAELPIVTRTVAEGDTISVGEHQLEVIHLVGHTPGSIALLYVEPTGAHHLWTGDSLFPGGVGNTEGDAQRFGSLIGDVQAKLFDRLPDETVFYPGHGADSTIGAERSSVPEWRDRGW
jgi:glyoxylase-like metal-dependent hydrolase (beta-lactamase superfamily II)